MPAALPSAQHEDPLPQSTIIELVSMVGDPPYPSLPAKCPTWRFDWLLLDRLLGRCPWRPSQQALQWRYSGPVEWEWPQRWNVSRSCRWLFQIGAQTWQKPRRAGLCVVDVPILTRGQKPQGTIWPLACRRATAIPTRKFWDSGLWEVVPKAKHHIVPCSSRASLRISSPVPIMAAWARLQQVCAIVWRVVAYKQEGQQAWILLPPLHPSSSPTSASTSLSVSLLQPTSDATSQALPSKQLAPSSSQTSSWPSSSGEPRSTKTLLPARTLSCSWNDRLRKARTRACVPPSWPSSPRHGPVASMSELSKSANQGQCRPSALAMLEQPCAWTCGAAGLQIHLRTMGAAAVDAIAPWLAAWHGIGWAALWMEFCGRYWFWFQQWCWLCNTRYQKCKTCEKWFVCLLFIICVMWPCDL